MRYFPVNLDINGRKVVVVGGGRIADRKVAGLVKCGSEVTVVSPEFCRALADRQGIRRVKRKYRKGDLKGAFIVICATDVASVNRRVYEHAVEMGIPVNVVDRPELCTFTVPAVISRRDLLVTVSTGGGSPALSRMIRRKIEEDIDETFADHLDLMKEIRPAVLSSGLDADARKRLFTRMAGREIHGIIVRHGSGAARRRLRSMLNGAVRRNCAGRRADS